MVKSPYEQNILERDVKQQSNNMDAFKIVAAYSRC